MKKDPFSEQEHLAIRAHQYIQLKFDTCNNKKIKYIVDIILKEQTKNKTKLHFSICVLIALLPYLNSFEQNERVLKKISEKIAQLEFEYREDYDLWEFILMRGQVKLMQGLHCEEVFAMCWTVKYNFGTSSEGELDAIKSHFQILISYGFDFFFNRSFYNSLHPHKIA